MIQGVQQIEQSVPQESQIWPPFLQRTKQFASPHSSLLLVDCEGKIGGRFVSIA
jgi:hypothetical protein